MQQDSKDPAVMKVQDMQRRAWLSKRGVTLGEPIQLGL